MSALLARLDLRGLVEAEGIDLTSRGWARCPLPGHEDRTASFQVARRNGAWRWRCWGACGRGGDAFDLLRELRGLGFREAADYLVRWSGAPLPTLEPARPGPAPKAPARPESLRFPPRCEVLRVWETALLLQEDRQVARLLVERGVSPCLLGPWEARALSPRAPLPRWASGWRQAHRLLLPLYDARGELVSLKARDVSGQARAKELAPRGFAVRGTLYASGSGAYLLKRPENCVVEQTELLVCEGGIDFLAACVASPRRPAWALPGSGHWTEGLAARVPDGIRVLVATDPDEAGESYAVQVAADLAARCDVRRLRPRGGQ